MLLKASKDTLCKELFVKVEKITRISRKMQLLTFRQFMLGPNRTMTSYKFGDENIVHLSVRGLGGGSTDDGMKIIIIIIITFHLCYASYCQLLTIYIAESSGTEVIMECVSCGGKQIYFFAKSVKVVGAKHVMSFGIEHPKKITHCQGKETFSCSDYYTIHVNVYMLTFLHLLYSHTIMSRYKYFTVH